MFDNARRTARTLQRDPDPPLEERPGFLDQATGVIANAALDVLTRKVNERIYDVEQLRIEIPQRGAWFGFGRRVIVPADQIHVVSGSGWRNDPLFLKRDTQVYGKAADKPSVYWANSLTQTIALRTITFVVPVSGGTNIGVNVLDSERVPFTVTAHVVAKVDETQPEIAAQRVGSDILGLVANIQEVTESQLLDAAAHMKLAEVISNRQVLAEKARDAVKKTLKDLGYNLILLTVSELGGTAFDKLVEQAEAGVTRDTTTQINAATLTTHQSNQAKARAQAEVDALTRQDTEGKRLAADEAVNEAELKKEETVAAGQHELELANTVREETLAKAQHQVALKRVGLQKEEALAQATATADEALLQQNREMELAQEAAQANATRTDLIQKRDLERQAQKTESDAERLKREKTAEAERLKAVKTTSAEAEAKALDIATKAETDAELLRANTGAQAAERQAVAKSRLAEATRVETAAPGLAQADVDERLVAVESQRVSVERERGLAKAAIDRENALAEIARAQGLLDVELKRQQELGQLFAQNPTLVELERLKLQHLQALELARIAAGTQVSIMQALAPHMDLRVHLIGDGSRASQIMAQVMAIAAGVQTLTDQSPLLGKMLGAVAPTTGTLPPVEKFMGLMPHIQQAIRGLNPRMLSTLTMAQLLERLIPVVVGKESLVEAVKGLKEDATFRLIADVPVQPIFERLGLNLTSDEDTAAAA